MVKLLIFLCIIFCIHKGLIANEKTKESFLEQTEDVKFAELRTLLLEWVSSDIKKQRKALYELSIRFNREEFRDIPDKLDAYKLLLASSEDTLFIKDSIHLLARMPIDENLLELCKKESTGENVKTLAGALAYLEVRDNAFFLKYFTERKYPDIPISIRRLFFSNPQIVEIRETYFYKMIKKMTELPQEKFYPLDRPNEGYFSLLKCNEPQILADYIDRNWSNFKEAYLIKMNFLSLLGQLQSSRLVSHLLELYLKDTNSCCSKPLIACLDRMQVKDVLYKISKAGLLDKFLKDVLPKDRLEKLKNKSDQECIDYFIENFDAIKKHAILIAQPQLG